MKTFLETEPMRIHLIVDGVSRSVAIFNLKRGGALPYRKIEPAIRKALRELRRDIKLHQPKP